MVFNFIIFTQCETLAYTWIIANNLPSKISPFGKGVHWPLFNTIVVVGTVLLCFCCCYNDHHDKLSALVPL